MADQIPSLHADLEYVKTLAHQGRHAPLTGGPILLVAGVVFGTAALLMYTYLTGMIPATQALANGTWIVATALFIGALIYLTRGEKRAPGAASLNNRANAAAWNGTGWGIGAFGMALTLAVWRLHDTNLIWLVAPVILTLYGAAWTVAAAMTAIRWLSWLAIASFLAAIGLGAMAGRPDMFLAYAATLYLLAGVPGYVLMQGQGHDRPAPAI